MSSEREVLAPESWNAPAVLPIHRVAEVSGTLRSPTGGGTGTMKGWLRLDTLLILSDRLAAGGVYSGALYDANGGLIGIDSRRKFAPAQLVRTPHGQATVVGPVDIDLIGFTVHVAACSFDLDEDEEAHDSTSMGVTNKAGRLT